MHENRTTYPKRKAQMYQLLQDLPKKYSVTALVRLEKVRASQLLPFSKKLLGEVEIVSIKDKVAKKSNLVLSDITTIEKIIFFIFSLDNFISFNLSKIIF